MFNFWDNLLNFLQFVTNFTLNEYTKTVVKNGGSLKIFIIFYIYAQVFKDIFFSFAYDRNFKDL